jgi:CBS-domain-containing membrane protein
MRRLANWIASVPTLLWAPVVSGVLTLAIGLFAFGANHPWLFPSLGPTIFIVAYMPTTRMAQMFNIVAGHGVGIMAGLIGVLATGAAWEPSVAQVASMTPERTWACVIAVTLSVFSQILTRAFHPPAVSTALLIAVGAFQVTFDDIGTLIVGIGLTALMGEPLRRMRQQRKS